ncbi:MAG: CHAT domain-containing protein [Anaerolineae bacterium]|nr:MAG: CHAT domain-containing protein [Anaerolineae bacterium]
MADDPGPAADLAEVGSRLFAAVFAGPVGTLLAASQASVAAEDAGCGCGCASRRTRPAGPAALGDPLRSGPGPFRGPGRGLPVLRYLALPRSRSALPVKPPLRVLAVLASPASLPALDVEREWQAIQEALADLVADGKFVLERLVSPTLDALQQRLLGEPVHILHFIGHGVFDEAGQAGALAFADARGRPHLVRGDDLAKLLRNHPAVRLAYLNACEGALAAGVGLHRRGAGAGARGAPAAVAMQAEISDPGAIELARTFYSALAAGRPVDAALTQARVALSAAGSQEWAIPVLFSRSPDNRLFDIRQVLPTPDCPYPGMVPFSEAQRELFFGRDREIEEATARLRQHPSWRSSAHRAAASRR